MNTLHRCFLTYFILLLTLLLGGCIKSKSPTIYSKDLVRLDGLVDGSYIWDGNDVEIHRLTNNQYQVISREDSNGKRTVRVLSILALDGVSHDLAVIEEAAVSEEHANTEYRFIRSGRDGIQVAEISLQRFNEQLATALGTNTKELDRQYGDEYMKIANSIVRDVYAKKKGINPALVTQEEANNNLSDAEGPLILAKADDEFKKRHGFSLSQFNGPVSSAVKSAERYKIFFDNKFMGGSDDVLMGELTSANLKSLFSDPEFQAAIKPLQWGKLKLEKENKETVRINQNASEHVLHAVHTGAYLRDDSIQIRLPDIAENGYVVPVDISAPRNLAKGEKLFVIVNDSYVAATLTPLNSDVRFFLRTRVKMPAYPTFDTDKRYRVGNLKVAVMGSGNSLRVAEANLKIDIQAIIYQPDAHPIDENGIKLRASRKNGSLDIKLLLPTPQSPEKAIDDVRIKVDGRDFIEMGLTIGISKNPFINVVRDKPGKVVSVEALTSDGRTLRIESNAQ